MSRLGKSGVTFTTKIDPKSGLEKKTSQGRYLSILFFFQQIDFRRLIFLALIFDKT